MPIRLPGIENVAPIQVPSPRFGAMIAHVDTSAIGMGLKEAGLGLERAGFNLAAQDRQNQAQAQAKVEQAARFDAQSRFLQFTQEQNQALQDQQQKAQPGAVGFTGSFVKGYDAAAQLFLESLPEPLREEYGPKLFQYKNSLRGDAQAFETGEQHRLGKEKLDQGQQIILDNLSANPGKAGDRTAADMADEQAKTLIENMPDASPILNDARMKDWQDQRARAIFNGRVQLYGPAEAGKGLVQQPPEVGGGGDYYTRLQQIEGGSAQAKNPNSSAAGYFQFTSDTAQKYGLPADARQASYDQQLAAVQRLTADNASYLRQKLGRDPTPGELYLAHQQGAEGAARLLANPNELAVDVVGEKAVRLNGGGPGETAQQFANRWISRFEGKGGAPVPGVPGAGVAPEYAGMSYENRMKLYGEAANADKTQLYQLQYTTDQALANDLASVEQSGQGTIAPGDMGQVEQQMMAAYGDKGAEKFAQWQHDRALASIVYAKSNGMDKMSDEQIDGIVNSVKPTGGEHAADQQAVYDKVAANAKTAKAARDSATKNAGEAAANGYVSKMLTAKSVEELQNMIPQIAADTTLSSTEKRIIGDAVASHIKDMATGGQQNYGPGFWNAYKDILSNQITDARAILSRAGPDGDLTLSGAEKLISVMNQGRRSVDDAAVNTAKGGMIAYAKSQLSFDQEVTFPGVPPMRDPKGEAIFNAQFLPKFEAAYDAWVKAGNDPWKFLTQENVDKMIVGLRPPGQMAADRIAAGVNANAATADSDPNANIIPPPPKGIDASQWQNVMTVAPYDAQGNAYTVKQWAGAVNALIQNQNSPEVIKDFDQWFKGSGITAQDVLSRLRTPLPSIEPLPPLPLPAPVPSQNLPFGIGSSVPETAQPVHPGEPAPAPEAAAPQPTKGRRRLPGPGSLDTLKMPGG